MRPTTTVNFLNERNAKDEKYYQVYDKYAPDYKKTLITGKFYSKYDTQFNDCEADPEIMEKVKRAQDDTAREKYPYPLTENQRYGWYTDLLVPVDRSDNRFYQPRKCTDFIAHALQQKMEESVLPKTKFTGIPFKFC